MKKFYSVVFALIIILLIPAFAFAASNEIDLSGMSYDELVELKDRINLAIWESEEWEEVEVPQGVWKVGADIPAGKWTIKTQPSAVVNVYVGDELKNGGVDVKVKATERIMDEKYKYFDPKSNVTEWTIELEDGQYVKVDFGVAVFSPYAGKPSLGFKQG